MGLVHNFSGLIAVRFSLDSAEAGLFPGIGYFLSCWYQRGEFGIRMAIFFSGAALANSFGGLLAAAIALMDGVGDKAGWCWISILEGLATVLIGVASFWMVQDFSDEATFLPPDGRKRALRWLALDEQASAGKEEFEMTYFWESVKDWKMYLYAVIYMGTDMPFYAFALFVPTIIEGLVSSPHRTNHWLTACRVSSDYHTSSPVCTNPQATNQSTPNSTVSHRTQRPPSLPSWSDIPQTGRVSAASPTLSSRLSASPVLPCCWVPNRLAFDMPGLSWAPLAFTQRFQTRSRGAAIIPKVSCLCPSRIVEY